MIIMADFKEHLLAGISILSAVCSATIIMAYALIPAVRKRKYFAALFYIGISNFITSLGSSFGFVRDDSPECWMQGIVTNVFSLSSIAWTVVVSLILNHAVTRAEMLEITPQMHVVCWGLPAIVTSLPLIELKFSSSGGKYWCFYVSEDQNYPYYKLVLWRWAGFFFWMLLGVVVILFLFIVADQKKAKLFTESAYLIRFVEKLRYYPMVIVICWLPGGIYDSVPYNSRYVNIATTTLGCLHGTLVAVIFWAQNNRIIQSLRRDNAKSEDVGVNLSSIASHTQSPMFEGQGEEGDGEAGDPDDPRDSYMSHEPDLRPTNNWYEKSGDIADEVTLPY
jgi:hypothetical protein